MTDIHRLHTSKRMSQAVMAPTGHTVYLAGQVATDRTTKTGRQTVWTAVEIRR